MDIDEQKIEIFHRHPCRCKIDGKAIYIAAPCYSIGHRVTKKRIAQLLHSLKQRQDER